MRTRGQARAELDSSSADTIYILVTGANTGLGLATCARLIDEFVQNRPDTQSLHLIATTRSTAKSNATIDTLRNHINRNAALKAAADRISLSSHEVDLTKLRTVFKLAETLNKTYPFLNSLICNAGIIGADGTHWGQAIIQIMLHPVTSATWPTFTKNTLRSLVRPQIDVAPGQVSSDHQDPEPPLGDVFTANVFGHYILSAHLMPLLSRTPPETGPGRIIWVSSVDAYDMAFSLDDIQCLDRRDAYCSSKRLQDILVLTSTLPSTQNAAKSFFSTSQSPSPSSPSSQRPAMYVCHPGIVATEIQPLLPPLRWGKILAFYIARLLGSPWHTIRPRLGATAPVWLALTPTTTLEGLEQRDGKGKWGSATDIFGHERVMRSDVDWWGCGGIVGVDAQFGRKGRRPGTVDVTHEARAEFEELGVKVWQKMEDMRLDWERRLGVSSAGDRSAAS